MHNSSHYFFAVLLIVLFFIYIFCSPYIYAYLDNKIYEIIEQIKDLKKKKTFSKNLSDEKHVLLQQIIKSEKNWKVIAQQEYEQAYEIQLENFHEKLFLLKEKNKKLLSLDKKREEINNIELVFEKILKITLSDNFDSLKFVDLIE